MPGKSLLWAVVICIAPCGYGFADETGQRLDLEASYSSPEQLQQHLARFGTWPVHVYWHQDKRVLFFLTMHYPVQRASSYVLAVVDEKTATTSVLDSGFFWPTKKHTTLGKLMYDYEQRVVFYADDSGMILGGSQIDLGIAKLPRKAATVPEVRIPRADPGGGFDDMFREALNQEIEGQLRKVVDTNIAGLRQENLEQCLSTFHPDGPGLAAAEKHMRQLFPVVDFEYEVPRFTMVGIDGDYATARILQRTRLVGEPLVAVEHRSSTLDMIMVFRKHKSEWRIWTSAILESTVQ